MPKKMVVPTTAAEHIENNFKYHAPQGDQAERYEKLRDQAKALAYTIVELCPDSPERMLAIRQLEGAVMWANASIARNE